MIVFDLKCACGCQFEGWFASRVDFEKQGHDHMISCPRCGGNNIHKILSPVAIRSCPPSSAQSPPVDEEPEVTMEMTLKVLRSLQDFVEKNFDDVGPKLAEESLKIHYGVVAPRNIRGVTTADEEKMLTDEGIELLKIPMIKKTTDSEPN